MSDNLGQLNTRPEKTKEWYQFLQAEREAYQKSVKESVSAGYRDHFNHQEELRRVRLELLFFNDNIFEVEKR